MSSSDPDPDPPSSPPLPPLQQQQPPFSPSALQSPRVTAMNSQPPPLLENMAAGQPDDHAPRNNDEQGQGQGQGKFRTFIQTFPRAVFFLFILALCGLAYGMQLFFSWLESSSLTLMKYCVSAFFFTKVPDMIATLWGPALWVWPYVRRPAFLICCALSRGFFAALQFLGFLLGVGLMGLGNVLSSLLPGGHLHVHGDQLHIHNGQTGGQSAAAEDPVLPPPPVYTSVPGNEERTAERGPEHLSPIESDLDSPLSLDGWARRDSLSSPTESEIQEDIFADMAMASRHLVEFRRYRNGNSLQAFEDRLEGVWQNSDEFQLWCERRSRIRQMALARGAAAAAASEADAAVALRGRSSNFPNAEFRLQPAPPRRSARLPRRSAPPTRIVTDPADPDFFYYDPDEDLNNGEGYLDTAPPSPGSPAPWVPSSHAQELAAMGFDADLIHLQSDDLASSPAEKVTDRPIQYTGAHQSSDDEDLYDSDQTVTAGSSGKTSPCTVIEVTHRGSLDMVERFGILTAGNRTFQSDAESVKAAAQIAIPSTPAALSVPPTPISATSAFPGFFPALDAF